MSRALTVIAAVALIACDGVGRVGEPPLMPLVHTESPSYTPELAREIESELLEGFTESGVVPELSNQRSAMTMGRVDTDILDDIIESDVARPEAKPPEGVKIEAEEEAGGFDDPRELARAVFEAILSQDKERYNKLFIGPVGLRKLVGVGADTAKQRTAALREKARPAFAAFTPGNTSEEPVGGLVSKLKLKRIEMGKPATLEGKTPKKGDETVQHWGTTVSFRFQDNDDDEEGELAPWPEDGGPKRMTFSLSLGRMLKTPGGGWKLASAPKVSPAFDAYLLAGLHLKPELMSPEHHPYPMTVGNFWRYRVQRPERRKPEVELGLAAPTDHTIRIEVTEVERFEGYRVVTLRRIEVIEEPETDIEHLLVTPRLVYRCNRYCKSRAKDLKYVLDYIRQNAPILVFPLKPGIAWTYGGVLGSDKTRYRTEPRLGEVNVPAGEYTGTVVIISDVRGGLDTRHFKPGVGLIKRVLRGDTGTRLEELVQYRILNTE